MNLEAIGAFLRSARVSNSLGAEPKPEPDAVRVEMRQVAAYRAAAQHVDRRLPHGSHAEAADAGLQDSAPRAALYALHARMDGVGPDDWEDPALVQIWFRLGADHVIPRHALDAFTVGTMPDDPVQRQALNDLGDVVRDAVVGGASRQRDIAAKLGPRLPDTHLVRIAQVSGRIVIRWDARTTQVIASDDPTTDPSEARVDLARRFVHRFGPVGPTHFAKWAAVPKTLARAAFDELDLACVDVGGRGRFVLRADADALVNAAPPDGVRLLPGGLDPYLYVDAPPVPSTPVAGPDVSPRLVNSLGGRILLDGELVGAWGRVQHNVTVFPWRSLAGDDVDRIGAEASSFRGPLGGKAVRVRWLDQR